ncbi:M50 family metallopeptidase [Sporosarcina aquimarina]|uniref:M50 family metallopeptidase n=1 Tax=Sporosarcina aquimarina TaxID=114975 RepID=UPI001C8F18D7|nr:M50 family metallopeptidase [Sporosarcina aquimarina]MBY0222541.1 M50 family metallopeptidase [Sporosarcina aquimarina]
MKFRIHPILLPIFLFFMIVGGVSLYAMILFSLLFHEVGHIWAAKQAGMNVRSCTILPYGGELQIVNRQLATKQQRLIVALGGPLATAVLLLIALLVSFPGSAQLIQIQLILLAVNLLPILPLDGGQALSVLLESKDDKYSSRSIFTLYSVIASIALFLFLSMYLPESLPYTIVAAFLAVQNIISYRFRKYEQVFEQMSKARRTTA